MKSKSLILSMQLHLACVKDKILLCCTVVASVISSVYRLFLKYYACLVFIHQWCNSITEKAPV